jgi:hypothetical protein
VVAALVALAVSGCGGGGLSESSSCPQFLKASMKDQMAFIASLGSDTVRTINAAAGDFGDTSAAAAWGAVSQECSTNGVNTVSDAIARAEQPPQ